MQLIIKATPTTDYYAIVDTVSDAVVAAGTRDQVAQRLLRTGRDGDPQPRLDRADRHGSSEIVEDEDDRCYGWETQHLLIRNSGDGKLLDRDDLPAYAAALADGDTARAEALLHTADAAPIPIRHDPPTDR